MQFSYFDSIMQSSYRVQPEFSEKPLNSNEDVNQWLRFYNMSAPLICLSVLISKDPVSGLASFAVSILHVCIMESGNEAMSGVCSGQSYSHTYTWQQIVVICSAVSELEFCQIAQERIIFFSYTCTLGGEEKLLMHS